MTRRPRLAVGSAAVLLSAALAWLAPLTGALAQNAERVEAVEWARAGEFDRAIARLRELRAAYPQDLPIAADLAVILQWAGRDREALEVFETIGADAAPDYALLAAARAARATGELARAEGYLAHGVRRFPDEAPWELLRALVYVDGGRFEEARSVLLSLHGPEPTDLDGLMARAYLAAQAGELPDALRFYTEVIRLQPENREALGGRVLALEALGGPFRAEELAETPPGLLDARERARVAGSQAAMVVNWGRLPVADPRQRFDATDRAIAMLEKQIAELRAEPRPDVPALERARLDLLIAYRDRFRMEDAVAGYEALLGEGVAVPGFARLSAASAYLYLERPEVAHDIYRSVVDENPRYFEIRFEAHLGLFYALMELERFREAYAVIDALDREQAEMIGYLGGGSAVPNELKSAAAVTAALARFYGGQLAEAWSRLSRMAGQAPAAGWLQGDTAAVDRARGWPRHALSRVEPWLSVTPEDVDLGLNRAGSLLALRRYPEAGAAIESLSARYPENKAARDLRRDWDVYRMWEWVTRVEPSYGSEPTIEEPGLSVETRLWSPPIGHYWRVTGAYRFATQEFEEGQETVHRTAAGLEYRGPALRAFAELTYNESTEDGFGGRAEVDWTPTDHVYLSAMGEIFSRDIPLRALRNGVTADAVHVAGRYRVHESTEAALGWRLMDFSDGNVRHEFFPRFTQRVLDWPVFTVAATAELYVSTNSRSDVAYFSPERIVTPALTLVAEHVAWRRYRRSFVHALTVTGGGTFQEGFDGEPIGVIAYEHRWRFGPQLDLAYGILFASRVFDGDREQEVAGFTQLSVRF